VKKLLPVVWQLEDGRAKAFKCIRDAIDWMEEQTTPKNDAVLSVRLPDEVKEFLRDGPAAMSAEARALICKALGIRWVSESKRGRGAITKLVTRPKTPKIKTKKARTA